MRAEAGMRTLQYGDRSFAYHLEEVDTERLKIEVHPDLRVCVRVPRGKSEAEIEARLRKRARWVFRSLAELARYHPLPTPKRYRSGETVYYLGKQYYLNVISDPESKVRLLAGNLEVRVLDPGDRDSVRRAVETWYRQRALDYLPRRVERNLVKADRSADKVPHIRVGAMKTRWGSCSPRGTITLNPELMKVPSPCIDYVILHEVCHLRVLNHGRDFYRLLETVCPDWRAQKQRLNQLG